MMKTPSRFFLLGALGLGFVLAFSSLSYAALTTTLSTGKTHFPRGVSAEIMRIDVTATGATEVLSSMTLSNISDAVHFGSGISRARIFLSLNGQFDSASTSISEETFSSSTLGDVTFTLNPQSIAANETRTFFVVYDIDADATLRVGDVAATTSIQVSSIVSSSGSADLSSQTTFLEATITGVRTIVAESIAPAIVLPGQTKVPIMKFSIAVSGEDMQDELAIRIANEAANFVTTSNTTKGITRAYLYYLANTEDSGFDVSDPSSSNLLKTLGPTTFTSSSEIVFDDSIFGKVAGFDAIAKDKAGINIDTFYLYYDIGEDFDITQQESVKAQLTGFSGNGTVSELEMDGAAFLPLPEDDPIEVSVAGLTFHSVTNIVPNHTFSSSTVIPMMRFVLRANHAPVTVNRVIIVNTGNFPFITDPDNVTGIKRIRIFEDTNHNSAFDGGDSADTLVSSLDLGNGNSVSTASLTINESTGGLLVPTFDDSSFTIYPSSNEKILFVVYDVADGQITTTTTQTSNTFLAGAVGKATVESITVTMNLRGTLPATSVPTASVILSRANLAIVTNGVENIAPTSAIRGQRKVPMLYLKIQGLMDEGQTIASSQVTILNATNTFLADNTGVSKVWIYRDDGTTARALDSSDTLLSSFIPTQNSSINRARLNGVPFKRGLQNLMVMYDMGQVAAFTTTNIRAQLDGIGGTSSGTAVSLAGETPAPNQAAKVAILPRQLKINSVTASGDEDGLSANSFTVVMIVENVTSKDISLTSLLPHFYLGSVGGRDVSSEFTFETSETFPVTVNALDTLTVQYTVQHTNPRSKGAGVVDGVAAYVVTGNFQAIESRYLNGNWFPAAASTDQVILSASDKTNPWDVPAFVESVVTVFGGTETPFKTGTAVLSGSEMKITFQEAGQFLDPGSLEVFLNGTALQPSTIQGSLSGGLYSYNETTGVLQIGNLGTSDGTLLVKANDLNANPFTDLSLGFLISSDKVRVQDLLFYPSPFKIGSETLQLGFNLTRAAADTPTKVDVYIYNFQGREIFHEEHEYTSVGYQVLTFDALSAFLRAGMYICRVVAVDSDGNRSVVSTRLAIY